ncbi:MAG: hypothetical protein ABSE59_04115 [Opitutaceae bacterium]|jgi:general secretion pathway protein H
MTVGGERPAGSLAALAKAAKGGRVRFSRSPRAAFTLLEILLALALLVLLLSASVGISAELAGGGKSETPTDVFWKALVAARKQALTSQQDIRMNFDAKGKAFLVGANVGAETDSATDAQAGAKQAAEAAAGTQSFAVSNAGDQLAVDFLPVGKTNTSVLIGGEMIETESLPYVTFYSDGTCTPFRVQFHSTGPAYVIAIDPWTCAQVLEEKK